MKEKLITLKNQLEKLESNAILLNSTIQHINRISYYKQIDILLGYLIGVNKEIENYIKPLNLLLYKIHEKINWINSN